jgi:molybdate transport system regulatory protein
MKVGYKVWLDNHGKAFGDGPYELLSRVEQTQSLHQAASQMGMSYSKAWRLIGALEKRLGFLLIERKVGGLSGGGSRVTSQGKELMKRYKHFQKDVKTSLEKIYRTHFNFEKEVFSK